MRSFLLACAFLPVPGTIPLAAQGWIHDLKSAPDKYLGQEVTVEGVVAGARPGADGKGGSYFLVDASDPAGIRVQTGKVPAEGGRFAVRGLLRAGEQGRGAPVLVETGRTRIGSSPLLIAMAVGSALVTLLLLLVFFRARRAERQHLLGAPLWLLPTSDPSATAGSAMRLDPSRDRTDTDIASRLSRRKRSLLAAVGAMTIATSSSAGWIAWAELSASTGAVFWQPSGFRESGTEATSSGLEPLTTDSAPTMLVVTPPPPPASPGRLRPAPERGSSPVRTEGSTRRSPPPAPPPASPVAPTETTVVLTVPRLPIATVLPLPPPPPPPSVVDSASARALREEQMRLAAETGLRALHGRLRAAIAGADREALSILWPTGLGSRGSRDRFFDFVDDFRPEATLGQFESPAILGDMSQSRGSITMSWRGDFGVSRTATATFVLALRRSGNSWTVEGVHLTARFP